LNAAVLRIRDDADDLEQGIVNLAVRQRFEERELDSSSELVPTACTPSRKPAAPPVPPGWLLLVSWI